MNGSLSSTVAGRVEICINNVYGAVCNSRWDERDASIVCRQLGRGECTVVISDFFGYLKLMFSILGNGSSIAVRDTVSQAVPIFLDDVVCEGKETNLLQCSHSRQQNCKQSDVAGVMCGGRIRTIYSD